MEFDNDRPVKPVYKIEFFYWVLLATINPLINSLTLFLGDTRIWWVLFLANLVVLPLYFLYAGIIIPKFIFQNRHKALTSTIFFLVIHLLLFLFYSVILQFKITLYEQSYFTYNYTTIIRESLWAMINMSLAASIYFIKRALDEKNIMMSLEKSVAGYKLKYLRARLNPHFLFNALNSIYSLSLQKSDNTPEFVVKLADLMRYMIYDCNEEKVHLAKEIEFIENYIEIEKIRYKADVRFTVEGKTEGVMIEPFLFISFIENGFKHAFNSSFTGSFIYITIKSTPGQLELSVVNNTNIDLESQAKRIDGTGIRNSKSILELLYPASYALNIIQTDKEEKRNSGMRLKHARERLEVLYPDSHTLDVILSNNAFTVSLILKSGSLDKMYHS